MYSAYVSKVEKARQYAQERDRVTIDSLSADFRGNHNTYKVSYDGAWHCTCSTFSNYGFCSHTMAMHRMLENMIPSASPAPSAASD